MIFTLYYMYSTLMQWWRLSSLRNKLAGTLGSESALIVCQKSQLGDAKERSCIENLLFHDRDRLGYTVVPKRTLSLKHFIQLPDTLKYFPIQVYESEMVYDSPIVHLLLVADLDNYSFGFGADSIQVETLGYPLGWNAENNLSIIVKSDLNGLTKLVSSFSKRKVVINYGLELLKVETINIEDHPLVINYENALKREKKLKYTVAPKQWNTFVTMVRGLSSKIHNHSSSMGSHTSSSKTSSKKHLESSSKVKSPGESSNSKVSSNKYHYDDAKKVPVSEVKPTVKKELKTEYGRHLDAGKRSSHSREKDGKSGEHKKRPKSSEKKEEINARAYDGSNIKIEVQEPSLEKSLDTPPPSASNSTIIQPENKTEETTVVAVNSEEIAGKPILNGAIKKEMPLKEDKKEHHHQSSKYKNSKEKDDKTRKHKKLAVKSKSADDSRLKEAQIRIKKMEMEIDDLVEEVVDVETKFKKSDSKDLKSFKHVPKEEEHKRKEHRHKEKSPKELKSPAGVEKSEEHSKTEMLKSKSKEKISAAASVEKLTEEPKTKQTEPKLAEVTVEPAPAAEKLIPLQAPSVATAVAKKERKTSTSKEELKLKLQEVKEAGSKSGSKDSTPTPPSTSSASLKSVPRRAESKDITDIKRDKLSILVKRRSLKQMKPPNVLIYADSLNAKENVKRVLQSVLNKDKYTVYDLPITGSLSGNQPTSPVLWMESATLLVVCGSVKANIIPQFMQFLVNGGQLLCLCSDLLYSILHTFTTAEVREHELVRFSYGEWTQIKMMHHIFCYQASPAKKQFSKDSESGSQSHSNGSSPIAPRTPNIVEIQHNNKTYTIQVQVLGSEETWQTPSLLLAIVKGTQGKAVFSQVHLEIDPTQYEYDEPTFNALKESNQARLEILKDLLSNHLGIDCGNSLAETEVAYKPAYFLGRHDLKQEMLSTNANIGEEKILQTDKITIQFCGKDCEKTATASDTHLSVFIHSCPDNFSTVQYFESLSAENIGRIAIYADVLTSTQHLLSKKLKHGIVVLARQQTQGTGRGGNAWLSPLGCAMFSVQLHIPIESELGKYIPLVQHLVMVAVVNAVRTLPGYEHIEIGIKWPNDLYAGGKVKIGGLITNTVLEGSEAVCNVGVGVNLSNTSPTTCINTLIDQHNQLNKTNLAALTYEKFLAIVFNELEKILNTVQNGNVQYLFDLYYKYWLHSDAEIRVFTKEGISRHVKIMGIDDYGFLKVQATDGTISSVQPDGNTFDMLHGLIAPKLN